jgi:hypothetical protein
VTIESASSSAAHPNPRRFQFRPVRGSDGIWEREDGAFIPITAPDWDRALELLRRINDLQDSSGRRISSLIQEDGFEPWWYAQDRLMRFYLVPLTQLFPLMEAAQDSPIRILNAPIDLQRVLTAFTGEDGLLLLPLGKQGRPGNVKQMGTSAWMLLALSLASLATFRWLKIDTIFYIVDHISPGLNHDFRFSPLYDQFRERGISFAEYAHTLLPRTGIRNFLQRKRPVFFLEAADDWARLSHWTPPISPWSGVLGPKTNGYGITSNSVEDQILDILAQKALEWCAESVGRQRALVRALKIQRARRALLFDDSRHNHELAAACHTVGIPVMGFQHGVFNRYHAGLMAYGLTDARPHGFDKYGVWSEVFRKRVLRDSTLYRADQVVVSGPIRPPAKLSPLVGDDCANTIQTPPRSTVRILVVSEPLARKGEVAPYLKYLLDNTDFELWFKFRPGESTSSLSEYSLPADQVHLLQTATVYDAFAQVDAVIGTYSSVLYEAVLANRPIVWMRTSRAYGRELYEEGFAEAANTPEDLPAAIQRALLQDETARTRLRARMWGENVSDGARRIIDELVALSPPAEEKNRR